MSLDIETLKILQQDAAFRAQFEPIEDLRKTHGLDQDDAEMVVDFAQRLNELSEEADQLKRNLEKFQTPVNWMKEGF